MYTPYCEYFTANLIYVYCMDPKTYWFLLGNLIHDYWKKQRRFPKSFLLSHFYGYICSMRNYFVLMQQVRIIYRYGSILTNACNVQISNNFMYYFSSSMIFFCETSYLNFQIFGKKSLNFIISRNIIESENCYE